MESRRIAILSEVLKAPLDEGIRIFAAEVALSLARRSEVTLAGGEEGEVRGLPVRGVLRDRWFAGAALGRFLRDAAPDAILYVPWTSLTARTFARTAILGRRAPGVPIGVVALQPRPADWLARAAARLGAPDLLFVSGPEAAAQAGALGLESVRLEGGVDTARFRPPGDEPIEDLRRHLGLPRSAFIVLHVGHLKPGRGVLSLKAAQSLEGVQTVLVASSSTVADAEIRRDLQAAGVRVIDHHLPRVEDYYRAADCYLFPVASSLDAIELPLSILEAAASNLPIVTTRFGGVPALLGQATPGVVYVDSEEEIPRALFGLRQDRPRPALRDRVAGLTWDAMAGRILQAFEALPGAGAAGSRRVEGDR